MRPPSQYCSGGVVPAAGEVSRVSLVSRFAATLHHTRILPRDRGLPPTSVTSVTSVTDLYLPFNEEREDRSYGR